MVINMEDKQNKVNNNYSFYDANIVLPNVSRLSSPPRNVQPFIESNGRNVAVDMSGKFGHNARNFTRQGNGMRERQFGLQDTLLESTDTGQSNTNQEHQQVLFVPQPPSKPKLKPTRGSLRPLKHDNTKRDSNLTNDKDLINMYKEFLNQRYCKSSTSGDEEGHSSGSEFSVSSLTELSSSDENTDCDLGNKTLTNSSFQPLYSLPRKGEENKLSRPKEHKNLLNKIVISNSRTLGDNTYLSACKAGSLPDLRSLDNIDIKKVSHVAKNESEAESEPGAERSYKFRPLPSIPGTSSNVSSNLYETLDGLSSKHKANNLPERNESKHRSFKEIASFLTLIPRLTTRSVRSRENDHRLADITQYLPDKKLKIFVGTWNMKGTRELPDSLDDFLLPPESVYLQDVYVIGIQEGTPFRREWQVRLQETFGPSHVLMQSSNFGVLQLSIFIRRELVWFCSKVEQDTTATRMGHKIKTKGALAMSFSVFGTSFLFITSHFTSHEGKLRDRINDYKAICQNIQLPYADSSTDDVTTRFDRVFWFGDFNFRVKKPRDVVDRMVLKYKNNKDFVINELLQHDQLNDIYKRGKIFHGFTEAPINFMPTYKFDVYTDDYDTSSKRRVPSWTDRIVYRTKQIQQLQSICYNSCDSIKNSDHRPVYAIFETKVEPYKNKFAVTGATYDRDVYVEANLRRTAPRGSQASSNVCTIL